MPAKRVADLPGWLDTDRGFLLRNLLAEQTGHCKTVLFMAIMMIVHVGGQVSREGTDVSGSNVVPFVRRRSSARLRVAGIALTVIGLVGGILIGHFAWSTTSGGSSSLKADEQCTANAVQQLPKAITDTVVAEQRRFHLSHDPRVLATRATADGFTAEALVWFKPQFCGFEGSIDYTAGQSTSSDGSNSNFMADEKDHVVLIRNGTSVQGVGDQFCVSDTVPEMRRNEQGYLEVVMSCDRLYPNSVWSQKNPRLLQP